MTFNKKAKNTSQFYYNTVTEKPRDIYQKLRGVISEYFQWYSTFQNKDPITEIELFSHDFICKNGCKLNVNHRMNVVDILLDRDSILDVLKEEGDISKLIIDIKKL